MSESIEQLKHDLMLVKIERSAALYREKEANCDWSKAAKEWLGEKNKLLAEIKKLKK